MGISLKYVACLDRTHLEGAIAVRAAESKLFGPSAAIAELGRIAPSTTTGAEQLTVMSMRKAVSSRVSVPWVLYASQTRGDRLAKSFRAMGGRKRQDLHDTVEGEGYKGKKSVWQK